MMIKDLLLLEKLIPAARAGLSELCLSEKDSQLLSGCARSKGAIRSEWGCLAAKLFAYIMTAVSEK